MSDGDAQQINEILGALETYMPNAARGTCGWHVVDRGWHSNGFSTKHMSQKLKNQWLIVKHHIIN